MSWILGLLYFILLSLLILYINRRQQMPMRHGMVVLAYALKVLAGIAYGYIFLHYYGGDDTWTHHFESLQQTQLLLNDPAHFFTGLLPDIENKQSGIFITEDSAWINLGYTLLVKLLGVFNLFTRGNYYINLLFINCLSMIGLQFFYAQFKKYAKQAGWVFFVLVFLIPEIVFWTSGIRKDILVLFFLLNALGFADRMISGNRNPFMYAMLILQVFLLFIMRNAAAILLVPALIAWMTGYKKKNVYAHFAIVYSICIVVFFLTAYSSSYNLPAKVAERQHSFLSLKGNTELPLSRLEPTLSSYIKVFPEAFNHVFLRPYLTEMKTPLHALSALHVLLLEGMFIGWLLSRRKSPPVQAENRPFFAFLLFYSLSAYLLIGYTVPFPGAIVRYKVAYELFLLLFFALQMDFFKNIKFLHIFIKKEKKGKID